MFTLYYNYLSIMSCAITRNHMINPNYLTIVLDVVEYIAIISYVSAYEKNDFNVSIKTRLIDLGGGHGKYPPSGR